MRPESRADDWRPSRPERGMRGRFERSRSVGSRDGGISLASGEPDSMVDV